LPKILFVARKQYCGGHHNTETFFPSAKNEMNSGRFRPGAALKIFDPATGAVTTLLETKDGHLRDPEVHFSGKKIVFSYRRDAADSYHIYEINADGSGLKQLTFMRDVDDIDPFYLADDHIAFSSTREPKYCGCNRHIMANLYRMEPDGANIHQISKNTLFDGHGSLLPDGRILYDRWEYVDRNFGDAQGLWTCYPDGTRHEIFWGNNTPSPGAVIQARAIPGSDKTVCTFSSCHDRPWGAVAIIDRKRGLEGPKPVINIWPAAARERIWDSERGDRYGFDNFSGLPLKYEDPYALDEQRVLATRRLEPKSEKTALFLLTTGGAAGNAKDGNAKGGSEILLYKEPAYDIGCYDPSPLTPRHRPPVLSTQRAYTGNTGAFYVLDVYQGTHMTGIKRGDVKYLRVVETPEKRFWSNGNWSGQGAIAPAIGWDDFMVKRILGTVPVNPDGSAYFECPSEKFVFFQLLDKDGLMLHSMRSGTMVQPGEKNGCVGCHDDRLAAVPANTRTVAKIFQRPPANLTPWRGLPASDTATLAAGGNTAVLTPEAATGDPALQPPFSYREQVQPVWDKYCVRCHTPEKPAGKKLNLTGASGVVFNPSYAELWAKHYIKPVGAGPARILNAKEWGSTQSKIVPFLRKKHGGVNLEKDDPAAFNRVITWIDINAPYYASYSTSYPNNPFGRSPLTGGELNQLSKLVGRNVSARPSDHGRVGHFLRDDISPRDINLLAGVEALNFEKPEASPCLAGLKAKDPAKYEAALAIVKRGAERVRTNGDNGTNHFTPCKLDLWRDAKYHDRLTREAANRAAIAAGEKLYDKP